MKIDSFKKFVILRHPLDRLVSGFRDKLGAPLVKKLSRYNYFEELKHAILLKFHPNSYQVWKMSESEQKLYLPFSTFIRWLETTLGWLRNDFQTCLCFRCEGLSKVYPSLHAWVYGEDHNLHAAQEILSFLNNWTILHAVLNVEQV